MGLPVALGVVRCARLSFTATGRVMGVSALGRCYVDLVDASNAHCSSLAGVTATHAVACEPVGGGYRLAKTALVDGVVTYVQYVPPVPAPCELQDPFFLSLADGALVSGAVAAVWLAAWAWRAISSVLRGDTEDLS